jgi:hypothetical protein
MLKLLQRVGVYLSRHHHSDKDILIYFWDASTWNIGWGPVFLNDDILPCR